MVDRIDEPASIPGPTRTKLPTGKKIEDIEGNLIDAYEKYKKMRESGRHYRQASVEQAWVTCEALLEGEPPAALYPYMTVYPSMEPRRIVETLKPLLIQELAPERQRFGIEPLGNQDPSDCIAAQRTMEILIGYDGWYQIHQWISGLLTYGTSYIYYGWEDVGFESYMNDKIDADGTERGRNKYGKDTFRPKEVGRPVLRYIDPRRVYTHAGVELAEDSPVVFVWDIESGPSIYAKAIAGVYDKALVEKALKEGCSIDTDRDNGKRGADTTAEMFRELDSVTAACDVVHAYTQDGWHYVLLGGKKLIMAERTETVKPPILTLRNFPEAGKHYGLPEVIIIADQLYMLSDVQSMLMDNAMRNLNPSYIVNTKYRNEWEKHQKAPGSVLFTAGVARGEAWDKDSPDNREGQIMNLLDYIKRDVRQSSGNTPEMSGSTNQRSAQGIRLLLDAAQARLWYKGQCALPQLTKLYSIIYEMCGDNLPEDYSIRFKEGGKSAFRKRVRDAFGGEILVRIRAAGEVEDKIASQQRIQAMFQASLGLPFVNAPALWRQMALAHDITDLDDVLIDIQSTERSVAEDIRDHMLTGAVPPFSTKDPSELVLQLWGAHVQTPEFQSMPIEYQQTAYEYLAQHEAYLNTMMVQSGQTTQQGLLSSGAPPSQESAAIAQGNGIGLQGAEMGGNIGGGGLQ
jgi:hypothetical protein